MMINKEEYKAYNKISHNKNKYIQRKGSISSKANH